MITAHSWSAAYVKAQQRELNPLDIRTDTFTNNTGCVSMSMTHIPTGLCAMVVHPRSQHEARAHLLAALTEQVFSGQKTAEPVVVTPQQARDMDETAGITQDKEQVK